MNKKWSALVIAILVLCLLSACVSQKDTEQTVPVTEPAAPETTAAVETEAETEPDIIFVDPGERDYESVELDPNDSGKATVPPATQPKPTQPRPVQAPDGKHYTNIFGENETAERDF